MFGNYNYKFNIYYFKMFAGVGKKFTDNNLAKALLGENENLEDDSVNTPQD